jgi:transcriptional regulator with XRE-family HTH domain
MVQIDLWKVVGQELRKRRQLAGISSADLATKVGIDTDALSAFEQDSRGMDLQTLGKIFDVLNINAEEFFQRCNLSQDTPTTFGFNHTKDELS